MERKFGIELEIVGITQEMALEALKAVQIKVSAEGCIYNESVIRTDSVEHHIEDLIRTGFISPEPDKES